MSRLLLDTTFLIDSMRRPHTVSELIDDPDDVAIAAISVTELLFGVELAAGKTRAERQAMVEDAVESVPILDYDLGVVAPHAELLAFARRSGRPRGAHDLIIAATARAAGRTVLTSDASAFTDLPGVDVVVYSR